jgi:hypothetical protein
MFSTSDTGNAAAVTTRGTPKTVVEAFSRLELGSTANAPAG